MLNVTISQILRINKKSAGSNFAQERKKQHNFNDGNNISHFAVTTHT